MTTYWVADTHFGHQRIIKLCKRPYSSIEEMNADLISKWNAVVQPESTVWCLGDFCWNGYEHIFHALNGQKHLIIGNHDPRPTLILPWASQPQVYQELTLKEDGVTTKLVLFHWPITEWQGFHRGTLHLHGHTHGTLPDKTGRCDVGVDRWDMQPVTLEQIKLRNAALIP